MSRYIRIEDAIEAAINGCASWDGGYFPSMDEPIKEEFEAVDDKCIDLVRCKECIEYRESVGGCHYFNYEPTDEMDFCSHGIRADGERKNGETDV